MEHGPTTTSNRGSLRSRICSMPRRPRTTVALAASLVGSCAFSALGGERRTISFTCKSCVGNIEPQALQVTRPINERIHREAPTVSNCFKLPENQRGRQTKAEENPADQRSEQDGLQVPNHSQRADDFRASGKETAGHPDSPHHQNSPRQELKAGVAAGRQPAPSRKGRFKLGLHLSFALGPLPLGKRGGFGV